MSASLPPPPAPPRFRGAFRADAAALRQHATAAGPFWIEPTAVAVPEDADDVQALVEWAAAESVALIPRGAATGMPGGNVGRGVAIDLAAGLGDIGEPDPDALTLRCGAGANAAAVARAAACVGLALPPLPSSADRCTIGGMVANNAAGARSFRHGATREWIEALDVVWSDGSRARLDAAPPPWARTLARDLTAEVGSARDRDWPRVRKNSSGYALDRFLPGADTRQLIAGSEGTLCVVVGVTLRLTPHPPERGVFLVGLPSIDLIPAAAAVAATVGASACELFGRRLVQMAALAGSELPDVAHDAEALVLIEVEGTADRVGHRLTALRAWAGALGLAAVASTDEEGRARLWEVRHAASPLIAQAADRGRRSTQFIEDSVVPVDAVPAYLRGLDEILGRAHTDAVVFGHAGDGNIHVNPLVEVGTPGWRARVRTILEETVDLVAGLGGTLSGEHGDGRVRAPYLDRIWSPPLAAAFRAVKRHLDPEGIMNPGVIIPLPGQDPLDGLWAGIPEGGVPAS